MITIIIGWLKEVVFYPTTGEKNPAAMAFQEKIPEISGSAQSTSLLFLQHLDPFRHCGRMGKSMRIHR